MMAWRCVCPTHNFESQDDDSMTVCLSDSQESDKMMAWHHDDDSLMSLSKTDDGNDVSVEHRPNHFFQNAFPLEALLKCVSTGLVGYKTLKSASR